VVAFFAVVRRACGRQLPMPLLPPKSPAQRVSAPGCCDGWNQSSDVGRSLTWFGNRGVRLAVFGRLFVRPQIFLIRAFLGFFWVREWLPFVLRSDAPSPRQEVDVTLLHQQTAGLCSLSWLLYPISGVLKIRRSSLTDFSWIILGRDVGSCLLRRSRLYLR
jgi:hypothetical protein